MNERWGAEFQSGYIGCNVGRLIGRQVSSAGGSELRPKARDNSRQVAESRRHLSLSASGILICRRCPPSASAANLE
jgi:hypothetical protein